MRYIKKFENSSDTELEDLIDHFSDLDLDFDCSVSGSRGLISLFIIDIEFERPSDVNVSQIFPEILNRTNRLKSIGEFDVYSFAKSSHIGVLRFNWVGGLFYENDNKYIGITNEMISNPRLIVNQIEDKIKKITGRREPPYQPERGYQCSIKSISLYFKKRSDLSII